MSLAELKNEIAALSAEEQEELRRFMVIERMKNDPNWRQEMDRRTDKIRAGNFYTEEDLKRVHAARLASES
ncbi:MAG TPA: hypothetical protein VK961_16540 [Chthoniobacter sp.]|nr:hypothetical protein [Chthoniobacter sp.]